MTTSSTPAAAATGDTMPPEIGNAYAFQVFNTLSFSIVAGAPMLVYFRGLNASDTILGVVAALVPICNCLQIPAARFVDRIGYKRFVLAGWSARSFVVLGMAVVAALPMFLDDGARLTLMLMLLTLWAALRGISVCGMLPWFTKLVPETVRGEYLSRDQLAMGASMCGALLLNALLLSGVDLGDRARWTFAALFFGSFIAAQVSLVFIRRLPDVAVPAWQEGGIPPFRAMLAHRPFAWLMGYHVLLLSAFAAAAVFWIPFFQEELAMTPSDVMVWAAVSAGAAALTLLFFGRLVDTTGSRPMMAVAGGLYIGQFLGWGAMAAGVLPPRFELLLLFNTVAGFGNAFFNLSMMRLVMATVPEMGRSHFFALYSVVTSVAMGVFPVLWGLVLDAIGEWRGTWLGLEWNRYSIFYAALTLIVGGSLFWLSRLDEPRAMRTDAFLRELLLRTPGRVMTRLLPRRPM